MRTSSPEAWKSPTAAPTDCCSWPSAKRPDPRTTGCGTFAMCSTACRPSSTSATLALHSTRTITPAVTCPKVPRIKTFVRRKDATQAAPRGLLPDANDTPANLIVLSVYKGFGSDELVALVGAHASFRQRFDSSLLNAGKPFDTTLGIWDINFYSAILQNLQNTDVFVLPSDRKLSSYKETRE